MSVILAWGTEKGNKSEFFSSKSCPERKCSPLTLVGFCLDDSGQCGVHFHMRKQLRENDHFSVIFENIVNVIGDLKKNMKPMFC